MTTMRTHFTFRVDTWTPDGESIVEQGSNVRIELRWAGPSGHALA